MFLENIGLAIASLRANKMRAILTMLGIIIGISAVIAIVTIGNAITSKVSTELQSFGVSNVIVQVRERAADAADQGPFGSENSAEDEDLITADTIDRFAVQYKDKIDGISLNDSGGSAQAKDGRLYANVSVTGVNDGYMVVNNLNLLSGRFISDKDVKSYKNVAVVSDKFVNNMFTKNQDPLGAEIKVYSDDSIDIYTIIGIYEYKAFSLFGASSAAEKDIRSNLYLPITVTKLDAKLKNYSYLTVMVKPGLDTIAITSEVENFFNQDYVNNTKWQASAINMGSEISSVTSMLDTISLAIAVIAGIALVVGGIGVMNIMLVSVTERTREIGTRKALGAKNFHIRFQFVIEAVIISLIGGLIGIILDVLSGVAVSLFLGSPVQISIPVIVFSVLFSMCIGIFFGYYPANKAAALDPIEALRYE